MIDRPTVRDGLSEGGKQLQGGEREGVRFKLDGINNEETPVSPLEVSLGGRRTTRERRKPSFRREVFGALLLRLNYNQL